MLVEPEIAAELAFHKRERTLDRGARGLDLLDRMRRFELHPIDAGLFAIGLEAQQRVFETAICGVARVALRHDDKVRVELVFHVDCGAVTGDRQIERHDFHTGVLGLALAFDRLVVDAHAGDAAADAFAHHAAHRHDPAMPGVAVHDDRDRNAVGDPAGDLDAFGQGRGADIGQPGIGADHSAGADEQCLTAGPLHDPGMRRGRRVEDRQHLVPAMDQILQALGLRAAHGDCLSRR